MSKEKSIALVGFMGVGKTTAGELASIKLKWEFIDTDQEIEKVVGLPTTEIFKKYGEKAFRTYEKKMIEEKTKEKKQVISLGGGAFMNEETRKTCLANTVVIFLDISWEAWKKRYDILVETRPVLQGRNLNEIKELYLERKQLYGHHHFCILTDNLSPDEVANKIVELYSTPISS
ncbi:shikimate kinase [Bacillus norwichensis]|uniref:Shikimate kinase n=1 Tax=Bacillus norwichensis TaxID=2762217 RepID=A0ABR8VFI8_9BACI|nr:shikimate kinase [Bacillus norwichensis]MBD8003541.1 shikimate kinase [Bacillus norwichensis]